MGNYNQGGRSRDDRGGRGGYGGGGGGGGRSYGGGGGGRGGFGGRDRGRPQMHPATCADCGAQCEVPFKPTGEKPVFCSNCFEGSGRGQSRPNREPSRPRFDDRPKPTEDHKAIKGQIDRLETKLDKILKILAPVVSSEVKEVKEVKEVTEKPVKKPAKKVTKKTTKKVTKKTTKKVAKKPAKKAVKKVAKKKK